MPKTKILVTGAGGFILSNYIRYILKNYSNYIVISLDRCDNASTLNELYINKDHDFYLADVSDEHIVDRIFQVEKPDYVIHGSWSYIKDNICGAQVISEACSKYGIKKLLYLSSNEVYGTLPTEEAQPFKESSKLNPGGLNGIQKISAESHIKYNKNYINTELQGMKARTAAAMEQGSQLITGFKLFQTQYGTPAVIGDLNATATKVLTAIPAAPTAILRVNSLRFVLIILLIYLLSFPAFKNRGTRYSLDVVFLMTVLTIQK